MIFVERLGLFRAMCAAVLVMGFAQAGRADEPVSAQKAAKTIRGLAVVDLGFEEPTGNALDAAAHGKSADTGELQNGVARADSPFWGQEDKRAILLNANRKQFVQIPDSPDVDRPHAVTVSFFFLSLHPLNDAGAHGIVAKRAETKGKSVTNYGINYVSKSDVFQLYINDGSGFRIATYSVKETINSRRLVHLTASWEVGDAPGSDADADRDDVRVRLFINGKAVAPKSVANGQIVGQDGWLQDINVAKLLNDVPVTLGSSTPTIEHVSGLVDEFLLFDLALNDEQAKALFQEVAGPRGGELAKQETAPAPSAKPLPTISATSLHGLQAGHATQLTISGANLQPHPRLVLPGVKFEQKILPGSNAGRLNVEATLAENVPLGWFPLSVETDQGLSTPVPIAIDTLAQLPAANTSPEKSSPLPAAFSGQIAGANTVKIYFRGQQGDRVAAEVEAKRLGSAMDPVVEIKTERGTPLEIGWGHTVLQGDARVECRLPEDGIYYVELHDLTYKAPGQNRFRLKVGDFRSVDQWFPAQADQSEKQPLKPIGAGFSAESSLELTGVKKTAEAVAMPKFRAGWDAVGPLPILPVSQAREVMEASPANGLQTVEAAFEKTPHLPVAINGIVTKAGEQDRYVLNVTPGQKLRFAVEARTLPSPLDALLTVRNHPAGNILVYKEDSGTARDPEVEFTVPNNIKQIQVGVEDLHERGGAQFVYRLLIAPANAPDFSLKIKNPSLILPANGTAIVEMSLTRKNYNGPISLRVQGDDSVSLIPKQIPASQGNGDFFVTLVRKSQKADQGYQGLKIVGETQGFKPEITRAAEVASVKGVVSLPGFTTLLPASVQPSVPFQIETAKLPLVLFKGVPANIRILVKRGGDKDSELAVRLSLLTTEATRPNDPKDPKKGNKPKIRAAQGQAIGRGKNQGTLKIAVPSDVAAKEIDAVIKAELVPHAYSGQVAGTVYSYPFKLSVQSAATVKLDQKSFNVTAGQDTLIKGTLERAAGFNRALTVGLSGLPTGYETREITVPAGEKTFAIPLKPGPETAAKTVKATFSVKLAGRSGVLPDQPVELKVAPAK